MTEGWKERLREERDGLAERVEKLEAFLKDGAPETDPWQRFLLRDQLCVMRRYLLILDQRLEGV